MSDTKRITLDLDEDLHKELKKHCLIELEMHMSDYIRDLIKADLGVEDEEADYVNKK